MRLEISTDVAVPPYLSRFIEVWISSGNGEVDVAYTITDAGVLQSTHRPILVRDPHAVYPPPLSQCETAVVVLDGTKHEIKMQHSPLGEYTMVCVDLYAEEPNSGAFRRIACCKLRPTEVKAAPLNDWCIKPMLHTPVARGTVTMQWTSPIPPPPPSVLEACEKNFMDQHALIAKHKEHWMALAETAARNAGFLPDTTSKHVFTPGNYDAYNTNFMSGSCVGYYMGDPRGFQASEAWMLRQLEHAINSRGMDSLHAMTMDDAEIVIDACCMWVSLQPYVEDHRWDGTEWIKTDTPSSAWVATANNCKDSARAAVHVLMWLITAEFTNEILKSAQRVARAFAPMLCLGSSCNISHVYGLAVPLALAVSMLPSASAVAKTQEWYATALSDSAHQEILVLEGTTRMACAPNPKRTPWRKKHERSTKHVTCMLWDHSRYQMTTGATAPIFAHLGLVKDSQRRFWFTDGTTISVPTKDVARSKLAHYPAECPCDIAHAQRRNERVTRMDVAGNLQKDAIEYVRASLDRWERAGKYMVRGGATSESAAESIVAGNFFPCYLLVSALPNAVLDLPRILSPCTAAWIVKAANHCIMVLCIK